MFETMEANSGVGLAAPQIGESIQLFIVSSEGEEIDRIEKEITDGDGKFDAVRDNLGNSEIKKKWNYYVFINPAIKKLSRRKIERSEGCLSVPGEFGTVKRNEKVTVKAYDEFGKSFIRGATRFFARIIQHEYDHLQGTLFIDKAEKLFKLNSHES